ncbi:hypothetical protein ACFL2P_02515 [Candidatus Moduliflexota bacterium]
MKIMGADYLQRIAGTEDFMGKMVFNDRGAYVFSARFQHRDMKAPGVSYDHEGRGNALAAMLKPGLVEIRFDPRFNNDRVMGILRKLLASPGLAAMRGWKVTYKGKPLGTLPAEAERSASMDIHRTEVILISKLPVRDMPWDGKLMVVRNRGVLYVPVVFYRESPDTPLHRHILAAAGLKHIRRGSPANLGGCHVKVFRGTMVLSGKSGDFGPVKQQGEVLPIIGEALRTFLGDRAIAVHEVDAGGLDV